jgi:hypothetical protein
MRTIPLHGAKAAGRSALIDDRDFGLVSPHRWNVAERTRANGSTETYAVTKIQGRMIKMHRLITGFQWKTVDHRNGNGLDNQRSNLRDGTTANQHNRKPTDGGTSRYKGVYWWTARSRWVAKIYFQSRPVFLGTFTDEDEAARAYNTKAIELFGEYARLNQLPDAA